MNLTELKQKPGQELLKIEDEMGAENVSYTHLRAHETDSDRG